MKTWAQMTTQEKAARILPLLDAGETYKDIARRLNAPSRNAVSGIIYRLREAGGLPNNQSLAPSSKQAKAGGAAPALNAPPATVPEAKTNVEACEVAPRKGRAKARADAPDGAELASRLDAGRTASATSEKMDVTSPGGENPALRSEIARFINRYGVRRFERGAITDIIYLQNYMAPKGFSVTLAPGPQGSFVVTGKGPVRRLTRSEFFAFVDRHRIADGLEPFRLRQERAA